MLGGHRWDPYQRDARAFSGNFGAQDLSFQRLAAEMPFKFADATFQLPHDLVAGDVIILGHGNTPAQVAVRSHPESIFP